MTPFAKKTQKVRKPRKLFKKNYIGQIFTEGLTLCVIKKAVLLIQLEDFYFKIKRDHFCIVDNKM